MASFPFDLYNYQILNSIKFSNISELLCMGFSFKILMIFMDKEIGISPLINQAVNAAAMRSKELGK